MVKVRVCMLHSSRWKPQAARGAPKGPRTSPQPALRLVRPVLIRSLLQTYLTMFVGSARVRILLQKGFHFRM